MEAKERILKLLEDGKITADEAAKLLEALKRSYGSDDCCRVIRFPHHHGQWFHRHHPHRKKVIVTMRDECCEDPEDIEFMAFACCK